MLSDYVAEVTSILNVVMEVSGEGFSNITVDYVEEHIEEPRGILFNVELKELLKSSTEDDDAEGLEEAETSI